MCIIVKKNVHLSDTLQITFINGAQYGGPDYNEMLSGYFSNVLFY